VTKPRSNTRCMVARMACCISLLCGLWLVLMDVALSAVPPVKIAQIPLLNAAGSMSGVAPDEFKLASGAGFLYQSGFDAGKWAGKLRKLALGIAGDGSVEGASIPEWDAADILSGKAGSQALPLPAHRNIYTVSPGAASGMVEFRWDKLAPSQQQALDASPLDGASDGLGARRVDFLRGVRSDEMGQPNGMFRLRGGVLGDIINSNVVHVGAPARDGVGTEYRLFYEARKNRLRAVYVGANDGMLHAFDAQNGVELFAYMPQAVIGNLNQLSRPDYVHRPYVDGAIAVAEARVQGKWKTLLAAGMGGGAQGVFALDISDPADFKSGAGVLWEFTDRDDAEMGNIFDVPVIARFRTRLVNGVAEYRHFIVVASGLNNYLADGFANPLAPAVLFLLSVDKAAGEPWKLGVNYFKFAKPVLDERLPNGLSSPAMVIDEDGAVHHAYAGDLQGNLWRFDFTGNLPWAKENKDVTPLFTALDALGQRQPITTRPRVVLAPVAGYVVLFGTGKFLEDADVDSANFAIQSFYGIYDAMQISYVVAGRSQLEPRMLSKGSGDVLNFTGKEFGYSEAAGGKRGWYFDFLASDKSGERSVSNPLAESGLLLFNSLIPCAAPCPGGGGRSYVLHALSGLPVEKASSGLLSQVGMLAAPVVLQVSTASSSRNAFGKAIIHRKSAVIHTGSGGAKGRLASGQGDAEGGLVDTALPAMRFSWRDILNWQELRLAAKKK